jgi:putative spermidine/putrescine transport system substrate-binding protein
MKTKLVAIASVSLLALSSGAAVAQDLTISLWGGGYAEEFRKIIVEPFEKQHNVKVTLDTGLSGERLAKLMATGGRGTDLVYFTDYQMAELAKRGLLQPVDKKALTNMDALQDFAKDPFGDGSCPAFTVAAVGLAYNSQLMKEAPTSWKQVVDADLPGKKGFPDINISYGPLTLGMISQLEGGSLEDMDPGFAKIASVKKNLQIFTGREILDAINQGDVPLAPHLNIMVRKDDSVPLRFTFPQEGGLGVLNLVCMIKGSEKSELAQQFIDFHLSKEIQSEMLVKQGEGTVRTDVETPSESKYNLISAENLARLKFFNVNTIVSNRADWISRWQEEVIAE